MQLVLRPCSLAQWEDKSTEHHRWVDSTALRMLESSLIFKNQYNISIVRITNLIFQEQNYLKNVYMRIFYNILACSSIRNAV